MIKTDEKTIPVFIEIADDINERAVGLMNRQSLEKDAGMLFVFDSEDHHNFWMKNTLISLDMIFISTDGKIVDIKQAIPCKADPCEIYAPLSKAKYVLEVNEGFAEQNNVNIDDKVDIKIA